MDALTNHMNKVARRNWRQYLAARPLLDAAREHKQKAQAQLAEAGALTAGPEHNYLLEQCLHQLDRGARAWLREADLAVSAAELAATSALNDVLACLALTRRDHDAYRELARLVCERPRAFVKARVLISDPAPDDVDGLVAVVERERAGVDWSEWPTWVGDVESLVTQLREEAA